MSSSTPVALLGQLTPSRKSAVLSPQQRDLARKGLAPSASPRRLALGDVTNHGSDASDVDTIKSANVAGQETVFLEPRPSKSVADTPSRFSGLVATAGALVGTVEGIYNALTSTPTDVEAVNEEACLENLTKRSQGKGRAGRSRAAASAANVANEDAAGSGNEVLNRREAKMAERLAKRCAREVAVQRHVALQKKEGKKKAAKLRKNQRAIKAAAFEEALPEMCPLSPLTAAATPECSSPVSVRSAGVPKAFPSTIPTDVLDKCVSAQPSLPSLSPISLTANPFALLAEDEPLPEPVAAPTITKNKEGFFWRALRLAGNVLATAAAVVTTAVGAIKRSLGWA